MVLMESKYLILIFHILSCLYTHYVQFVQQYELNHNNLQITHQDQ